MACITSSTKPAGSSPCTVTKGQLLPSPARGARPRKPQRPPARSFLLAAPSAVIMMRCSETLKHVFTAHRRVDHVLCSPLCMFWVLFQSKKPFLIQRRGAEFSLTTVARHFGADLTKTLPYLWENTVGPLRGVVTEHQSIGRLIWWITAALTV